jgi:hypothetical protein
VEFFFSHQKNTGRLTSKYVLENQTFPGEGAMVPQTRRQETRQFGRGAFVSFPVLEAGAIPHRCMIICVL